MTRTSGGQELPQEFQIAIIYLYLDSSILEGALQLLQERLMKTHLEVIYHFQKLKETPILFSTFIIEDLCLRYQGHYT
jgi:hypothetical protein